MTSKAWPALLLLLLACVSGCDFSDPGSSNRVDDDDVDDGDGDAPPTRPSLRCGPSGDDWLRVQSLYDTTEASVHELITCGGLQVRIATNIVMMLIASNEDLFKDEERATVEPFTVNPFVQTPEGTWSMAIADSPGSTFALSFYDPESGELIQDDVFDLDSYLQGVHIQTEVGFDEMVEDPTRRNSFVFTWDGEGPLAHLMNGGQPLPDGADGFELLLSISDFLDSQASDFGPFASVFALEADSVVTFIDERGDDEVEYRAKAVRDQLDHIASSQSLAFEVERLEGRDPDLTLTGDTSDLTFVRIGELAGRIDYELSGELDGRSVEMRVRSDFGTGAAYPEAEWSCP